MPLPPVSIAPSNNNKMNQNQLTLVPPVYVEDVMEAMRKRIVELEEKVEKMKFEKVEDFARECSREFGRWNTCRSTNEDKIDDIKEKYKEVYGEDKEIDLDGLLECLHCWSEYYDVCEKCKKIDDLEGDYVCRDCCEEE